MTHVEMDAHLLQRKTITKDYCIDIRWHFCCLPARSLEAIASHQNIALSSLASHTIKTRPDPHYHARAHLLPVESVDFEHFGQQQRIQFLHVAGHDGKIFAQVRNGRLLQSK